ncbi:MucB/RseB C-terminal domain-containing protein [Glaciecola sp. XM2]|uniref:MucB/RseB C-terminal domain-containing protein n=1 Tax=Glaciecola sp. XM2 TaxID=1914931 RepID=UPI001BDEA0E6|nr:MucB/RseB C-terminal domain-containing protein [Glaciecola sp. XM2]MBT1452319.1 MucB/RseB C-terminal domain-containing protein [Glaciecola sp. XM2]
MSAKNQHWRLCIALVGFFSFVFHTSAQEISQQVASPTQESAESVDSQDDTSTFNPLSAESWMQRLVENTQNSAFEIIFVVSANQRETMPYMWRRGVMPNQSPIEQLSLLNGPGFEQVAHMGRLSIFEPGYAPYSVQGSHVQGPIPQAFIYEGFDLSAAYDVLLMGRNRVSARMAQQIRVISKDKTRFSYHLWLDEQTGLLLKLDMYDLDGSLLEQIQVTQLTVSQSVNQVFSNFSVDQLPQVSTSNAQSSRELLWQAGYLPVGMRVLKQDVHRIQRTGQMTEYMLLSDGLVDVSVYVMNANEAFQEDLAVATGSHAVISKTDGRVQVTVVGEIPVVTAEKIAESIVIVDNQDD